MTEPRISPLVWTQKHDFKLGACIDFALADWKTPEPKLAELKAVLGWFRFNMSRVRLLMIVPAQASALAMDMRGWLDAAELEITGTLAGSAPNKEIREKVENRMSELSRIHTSEWMKLQGTPDWDKSVRNRIAGGMAAVHLMASSSAAEGGIDALLASMITGTWTALEAMAADLWETAVNLRPAHLAKLSGKAASRFGKDRNAASAETKRAENDDAKSVRLDVLQEYQFDIRNRMGTILKRKFDFGRLSGIQKAYGSAFETDAGAIDSLLRSSALEALIVVRNLLIHKANVVDTEYLRRAKKLPVPAGALGNRIILDGETVVNLVAPAIECGAKLISAVDMWLDNHN